MRWISQQGAREHEGSPTSPGIHKKKPNVPDRGSFLIVLCSGGAFVECCAALGEALSG